jgi:hypothetical protein
LDLKASIDEDEECTSEYTEPCCERLCQVSDLKQDEIKLLQKCQMHKCSDYCLRKMKVKDVAEHNQMQGAQNKVTQLLKLSCLTLF